MTAASYLVLPLERVKRILADQALALGEIDRQRTGVSALAVLAQHVERNLHPAHRSLQRQVGIEHARDAALFADGIKANLDALMEMGELTQAPPLAGFVDASFLAKMV